MTPQRRRTLGLVLIVVGVLAWAPFVYLVANGRLVSIFPFLIAHLAGVLSGEWLRSSANQMEGLTPSVQGRKRRIVSTVMIYLGVLAWAPYFYLDKVIGQDLQMGPFLAAHLTGVLGGGVLRASVELERFVQRK
jgi:hypothetical protein